VKQELLNEINSPLLQRQHFQIRLPVKIRRSKYIVSQEETSILWEVIVYVILRKKYTCTLVLFRTFSKRGLFHGTVPKLLIIKGYYVLLLIPVFTVHFRKFLRQLNEFYDSCEDMVCSSSVRVQCTVCQ
jgi:hypothetical protein